MRKFLVALAALLSVPCASRSQDFERPGLKPVETMTERFLSSADAAQLSFDGPRWAAAVESFLAVASDSSVAAFRPSCVRRFDLNEGCVAWAALWQRGGKARLVWFAVSGICKPDGGFPDDGLRRSAAFVDDVGGSDSLLSVIPVERDGLAGLAVAREGRETLFSVPDVPSRMALRIMTGVSFSDGEKEAAESLFRSRISSAKATLAADLSGFPELTFCDSPDSRLRTVTYMVSHFDFTSHCGGWIVVRPKRGEASLFPLSDATAKIGQPDQAILTPSSWYGAIYSDIIQFRNDRTDYYALVGYKGATPTVKTRVLDVAAVGSDGKPVFGAKVFRHPKMSYRRRIFQYSAKSSMVIRYDEKSRIIVMDHLEPAQRLMVGHPEFYGPDLSYDAYVLTDDGWEFQSDIQVTEEEGAVPNEDDGSSPADDFELPQGSSRRAVNVGSQQPQSPKVRKSSGSSSWSGRSSHSSRRNKSSSVNSWFDKGKGNSAPNIRKR